MRFEAKHSYFKQLAHSMGNFVNICYSLTTRHQLLQCCLNINAKQIPGFDDNIEAGPGQKIFLLFCLYAEYYAGSVVPNVTRSAKRGLIAFPNIQV